MRKHVLLTLCFCLLFATAAQAEVKIAIFNVQEVVSKSDAMKEAQLRMKQEYDAEKTQLEKQREELEKQAKSINASSPEPKQKAYLKAQREYSDKANAYVRKVQASEQAIRQEMDKVILLASSQFASKKGLNLVLDSNSTLFADPTLDITPDMLGEVNRVWQEAKKK